MFYRIIPLVNFYLCHKILCPQLLVPLWYLGFYSALDMSISLIMNN